MTRQGLKRLECPEQCGALVYATLSQLERHGRPTCACGAGRMVPESLEVAAAVMERSELEQTAAHAEYVAQLRSVDHGQAPALARQAQGRDVKVRQRDSVAFERVERDTRSRARTRRLSGLRQYQAAALAAAEMPF